MVGFDPEKEDLDSDKLRRYIFGGHVAEYMRYLNENDEERYKSHFSRFIKEGVTADKVRLLLLLFVCFDVRLLSMYADRGDVSGCSSKDPS